MITKNINEFSDNYSQLFANASKALRTKYPNDEVYKNININTLEEYFAHLNTLYQLKAEVLRDENDEIIANIYNGKTYGILPLQEPIIPINANTRKIEIPKEMQNIGVAGDFGAEILYFVIDRYFDNHDLAADDIITVIEWSNPNVTSGAKRGRQKAYTTLTNIPAYLSSDINPNLMGSKLMIGWALGGDVMSAAGTIEFTIRFYQVDGDDILFSWSTIPEKLIISKTLQYDLFDDIDDSVNDIVSSRITTMSSSGVGGLLNPPVFFMNLDVTGEGDSKVTDYDAANGIYYIDIPESSTTNPKSYVATVSARSNTHDCEYTWQYHDIDTNGAYSPYDSKLYGDNYLVVTADMNREGLIMYVQESDGSYVRAESVTNNDIANGAIYYKVSTCTINQPGWYKARATIKTSMASAKAESYTLVVPGPATPQIENIKQDNQIEDIDYISVILDANNSAVIDVKIKDNTQDTSNITSYSWGKNNIANSHTSMQKPESYSITMEGNTNTLSINKEGWYKVAATNTRNNSDASNESNAIYYRVTYPAQPVKIAEDLVGLISKNSSPYLILDCAGISFDKVTVQWYTVGVGSTQEAKGDPQTYFPDQFINNQYKVNYDDVNDPLSPGVLTATITTYYNNTKNDQKAGFVTIIDN